MLQGFRALEYDMSLKSLFVSSHLDVFSKNLGTVSEEQGERFHRSIREMKRRYQGRWNTSMIADYWWMLVSGFYGNTQDKIQEKNIPDQTNKILLMCYTQSELKCEIG